MMSSENTEISSIGIHTLPLFNITNSINSNNKKYLGIVLGSQSTNVLTISISFEIIVEQGQIDIKFLKDRIELFSKILPDLRPVGFYQILNDSEPNSQTVSYGNQILDILQQDSLIYLIINSYNIQSKNFLSGFQYFKNYDRSDKLSISILSDNIENISISTINNHQNYFTNDQSKSEEAIKNIDLQDYKTHLNISLNQLSLRVATLVNYLLSDKQQNYSLLKAIELNNLIAQLVKQINCMKSKKNNDNDYAEKYLSSELSLLTSHLSILDKLKYQINYNMSKSALKSRKQGIY